MQNYILLLIGTSCSGKSTLAAQLFSGYQHLYHAKSDNIKRFISGYDRNTDKTMLTNITLGTAKAAALEGLSLLVEPHSDSLIGYKQLATDIGYRLITIYLEAPYLILEKRFIDRVNNHKQSGSKLQVNTDITKFKRLYDNYKALDKSDATFVFDTSTVSVEDMASQIDAKIQETQGNA